MGVVRTTVTAMYESARKKLIITVVEGKRLCIAGGNIKIDRDRNQLSVDIKGKGENIMRVAVTYDNGNIFGHFGRTERNSQIIRYRLKFAPPFSGACGIYQEVLLPTA